MLNHHPSTPSKGRSRASSVPPVMPTPTRKTTYGEPSSKGKDPPRYYKKKGPGIPDPNKYQRTLDNPIDNPVPYSASSLPVSRQTSDRTRSTTNVPSDVSGFGGGPSGREFPSVGTQTDLHKFLPRRENETNVEYSRRLNDFILSNPEQYSPQLQQAAYKNINRASETETKNFFQKNKLLLSAGLGVGGFLLTEFVKGKNKRSNNMDPYNNLVNLAKIPRLV